MKNLKTQEEFVNEAKIAIVKKSELDSNWSAEYNVSSDIAKIKKEKLSKNELIEKVISIVKKIGEDNYKDTIKYVKKNFYKSLPSYDSAIKDSYWKKKFTTISDIIIVLGSITPSMKITKEKLEKDIESFKNRIKNIDKINEGISRTYGEFTEDLEDEIKRRFSNITDNQLWDVLNYYHDKGWLRNMWKDGYTLKDTLDELVEKDDEGTQILKWFK